MLTSLSSIHGYLHRVPLREGAGLISPHLCPESPKSYREALWESCLANSGPAQSRCLFLPTGPSCGLQSYPCILEQDKGEERSCWPKGQRNGLPRAPSLTTPLNPLALSSPFGTSRASLQGQPSRTPTASCFKGSQAQINHTGWQPPRPSAQGCVLLLDFCFRCYPGSPKGNKGWDGCLTSWGLNSPPLSPLSSRKLPSKPLLRARQTAGGRERGQMGDWPKTSRLGHRAGPTEVLGRPHGAGQSINQGSSPKQQAFQGVVLPSDAKGLAWVRP